MTIENKEMGISFEVDNQQDFDKWYAIRKEQIRADVIDECIKVIGGNIKSIVGIYNKDTPLTDRASYRVAKNELIEELVKQLEQLKEQPRVTPT